MKQSWGPGLLILGAVVLIEGEPPVLEWVGWWGFRGHPLPSSPCSLVCVKTACGWQSACGDRPCLAVCGDVCVAVWVEESVCRAVSACVFPVPLSAPLLPARP